MRGRRLTLFMLREELRTLDHERRRVVYVIRSHATGLVKIGHSREVEKRAAALRTASGEKMTILLTIPGGADLEARVHELYAAHRVRGEWFRLAPEVVEFVRTGKSDTVQDEARDRYMAAIDESVARLNRRIEDLS